MSEVPERNEIEKEMIQAEAHRRWESKGQPYGTDQEHWLDAEAKLQAQKIISRRPILLPFLVSFTANDVADPPPRIDFKALLPPRADNSMGLIRISATGADDVIQHHDLLGPQLLAHEARLVAAQVSTIVMALDRISRLADWLALEDSPDPRLFEPTWIQGGRAGFYRLKPEYRDALLAPDANARLVADIDRVISNHFLASGVASDVLQISLGSNTSILADLQAMGWKRAIATAALGLGISFGGGFATHVGGNLGDWVVPPGIHGQDHPAKGTAGKIEVQPEHQQREFWSNVQRDATAEAALL